MVYFHIPSMLSLLCVAIVNVKGKGKGHLRTGRTKGGVEV